jgi:hypothetical protein
MTWQGRAGRLQWTFSTSHALNITFPPSISMLTVRSRKKPSIQLQWTAQHTQLPLLWTAHRHSVGRVTSHHVSSLTINVCKEWWDKQDKSIVRHFNVNFNMRWCKSCQMSDFIWQIKSHCLCPAHVPAYQSVRLSALQPARLKGWP